MSEGSATASVAALKELQRIHKLMLALEQKTLASASQDFAATSNRMTEGPAFSEFDLQPLISALRALPESGSIEIQKIREIADHLHAGMTAKQFSNWIVPVERALGRELRDDQFLIHSTDGMLKDLGAQSSQVAKLPLVFVLENLRSAFNVGSIFRTAECFGVEKIYLAGYTPSPDQEKLAKTAMGTQSLVAWEHIPKAAVLLAKLRSDGYSVVAFETTSHAVEVQAAFAEKPTAFVFGNERFGLEADLLEQCSEVRKIPLRGLKNSLNVGVATAVATYEFARQYTARTSK